MDVNSIIQTAAYQPRLEELKTVEAASQKQDVQAAAKEERAADRDVYIPSQETGVESNEALAERLKAEQAAIQERFLRTVRESITQQGKEVVAGEGIWKLIAQGDFQVDPQMKAAAQEAISEDGYWGVEQTAQRIVDFAKALAGSDPEMADTAMEAFIKGYEEAEEAWGGALPEICGKTYDRAMELFDEWKQGTDIAE